MSSFINAAENGQLPEFKNLITSLDLSGNTLYNLNDIQK